MEQTPMFNKSITLMTILPTILNLRDMILTPADNGEIWYTAESHNDDLSIHLYIHRLDDPFGGFGLIYTVVDSWDDITLVGTLPEIISHFESAELENSLFLEAV